MSNNSNKHYTILYGYVNEFDKFISLQAYHRQSQAQADVLLQEWSTQVEIGVRRGYVTNLRVHVNPDTYVIESPLYLTFKTTGTGYRMFEVWVVTSDEDIFDYIQRTPSADNMPDMDMNLIPFFGLPLSGLQPQTNNTRFVLTGSPRSTIIKKM